MDEFISDLWRLKLPNKWQGEPQQDCTIFSHVDGVGALQIETFQKPGDVVGEDLKFLAEELLPLAEAGDLRLGDFNGFELELNKADGYWHYWFVATGNTALAITYNCDNDDLQQEAGVVLEILRSLRIGEND